MVGFRNKKLALRRKENESLRQTRNDWWWVANTVVEIYNIWGSTDFARIGTQHLGVGTCETVREEEDGGQKRG